MRFGHVTNRGPEVADAVAGEAASRCGSRRVVSRPARARARRWWDVLATLWSISAAISSTERSPCARTSTISLCGRWTAPWRPRPGPRTARPWRPGHPCIPSWTPPRACQSSNDYLTKPDVGRDCSNTYLNKGEGGCLKRSLSIRKRCADVRDKYRDVALHPEGQFHFHTGRPLAALLGYPSEVVDALPDRAVESFAGVGNPFSVRPVQPGERLVDFGSVAGSTASSPPRPSATTAR